MNDIIHYQGLTMSSNEIALLTGKRHDHVLRDIEVILKEAGIDAPEFGGTYFDGSNRESKCYNLPKRECDLVISGYSVKYRLAIIDRWHQLENNPSSTPAIANMQQQMMTMQQQLNDVSSAVRNGVPPGYMSRRTALRQLGQHLSMEMFEMVLEEQSVQKETYISVGQGYESPTFGWKTEEIEPAITSFIEDAVQVSKTMCSSPLLHGKRFRYVKENIE